MLRKKINRRSFLTGTVATLVTGATAKESSPKRLVELPKKSPVGWLFEFEMDGYVQRYFYPAVEYKEEYIKNIFDQSLHQRKKLTPLYA